MFMSWTFQLSAFKYLSIGALWYVVILGRETDEHVPWVGTSVCGVVLVSVSLNTSMSSRDYSIVEYYAEHEGYSCGYCKSTDTNYSHGKKQIKLLARSLNCSEFG